MENIKLNTRFGELSIDPSKVITFPRGIPGFEACTRWTLFHELNESGNVVSGVVIHLQSIEDENVSLPLTEPNLFGFNYQLVLTDSEVAELQMTDPADMLVLTTLSGGRGDDAVPGNIPAANLYTNISAPILINTRTRIGMQKTLVGRESRIDFNTSVIL